MVEALAGYGIPQGQIMLLVVHKGRHIAKDTLHHHFRAELDSGMAKANAKIAGALFKNAIDHNNVAAQIWWTKVRMGWKEPAQDMLVGGLAGAPAIQIVVKPSN